MSDEALQPAAPATPAPEPAAAAEAPPQPGAAEDKIAAIDLQIDAATKESETAGNELAQVEARIAEIELRVPALQIELENLRKRQAELQQFRAKRAEQVAALQTLRAKWPDEPGERILLATDDPAFVEELTWTESGLVSKRLPLLARL